MRKVILAMQTSFDGFVCGPEGDMSWMEPEDKEQWNELFAMTENVDLLLLGGGMWQEYRDYWKRALIYEGFSDDELKYARFAEKTPHIVFSSSIQSPGWENTKVENGDLYDVVSRLKSEPGSDIYVVGGAKFAASMVDSGLVDEFRIMVGPMIVGKGKSLFQNLSTRHELKRIDIRPLRNGNVLMIYKQVDCRDADDFDPGR